MPPNARPAQDERSCILDENVHRIGVYRTKGARHVLDRIVTVDPTEAGVQPLGLSGRPRRTSPEFQAGHNRRI
jgi:hypothetical protein